MVYIDEIGEVDNGHDVTRYIEKYIFDEIIKPLLYDHKSPVDIKHPRNKIKDIIKTVKDIPML